MFDLSALKEMDWLLVVAMVLILAIGVVVIYSASASREVNFAKKQIVWAALGLVAFLVATCFNYQKLKRIAPWFYLAMLAALIALEVYGEIRKGSTRWITFGGGFQFQPSEFMKLGIIVLLAAYLSTSKERSDTFGYVLIPVLIVAVPVGLIMLQPDLGTSIVLLPVLFGMLFVAGARMRYLAIFVALGIAAAPVLWLKMSPYQKKRVIEFFPASQRQFLVPFLTKNEREEIRMRLDPLGRKPLEECLAEGGQGWHSEQSKIAVGSGGLYGNGWMSGSQTQLRFLPEARTDFVFPVLCEEWGFLGGMLLLALYLLLLTIGLRVASESVDTFGRLVASGIVVLLAAHILINTSMAIGLIPITGLPLPLVSYGGSSLLATMAGLGFLESIHTRRYYFRADRLAI